MSTPHTPLSLEALERRECPTTAVLFRGTLTVRGTDGDDVIVVSRGSDTVQAAGQSLPLSAVRRLVITGGAGNDFIHNRTGLPSIIFGGVGDDVIYGGRGPDVLYGGSGDDRLYGGWGSDIIYGGSGTNVIDGGPGDNIVFNASPRLVAHNSGLEMQIVQLVNEYRASFGLAPLRVNGQLNAAAAIHSQNMASVSNTTTPWQAMQHVLPGSSHPTPQDRLDAAGYDDWRTRFAWGENIAFGFRTAAEVVQAWINSPSHRQNLLSPNFTETGVGIRADRSGVLFFTQTFGTRQ